MKKFDVFRDVFVVVVVVTVAIDVEVKVEVNVNFKICGRYVSFYLLRALTSTNASFYSYLNVRSTNFLFFSATLSPMPRPPPTAAERNVLLIFYYSLNPLQL